MSKDLAGFDNVNYPIHYTSNPDGIECIDVTRHMNFNTGNAVKYLWRAGLKAPEAINRELMAAVEVQNRMREKQIEDLQKACWYINDEIKRLQSTR